MQKQNRKLFVIALTIFLFSLVIGCKTQQSELKGFWENETKIVEFGENYFVIYNKDSPEVIAFKGSYSFADNPAYAVKMTYEECLTSEGIWISLKGTELENYTDTILFKVDKDSLETKVLGNGQRYFYTRTKNPMNIED